MQEANDETILGDFDDATFTYAGVTSTFYWRNGRFFVRTDGPDGELQDYPIAYTFGVTPLQQYLIEFTDGRLQALSVSWDARTEEEGGQRWFHLYPDERVDHKDILHWTGPLQNWNFMCAECHSTDLRKNYRAGEDRFETAWSEIDVACEACHGPGSNHLSWAEAVAEGDTPEASNSGLVVKLGDADGAQWIMDAQAGVARLSQPRHSQSQLETCLVDTHRPALLTEELYHADGQIKDEVYVYGSFLQSRMHTAGVTCTDCHDPHSLRLNATGNGLCSACHLAARFDSPEHHHHAPGSPGAECVECHMPARNYMVVDPRRDHSFRVPRPDLTVKLGTPNACQGCHEAETARWAAEHVVGWFGRDRSETPHFGEAIHAGRRVLAGADSALRGLTDDPEVPGIVRATALLLMRDNPGPAMPSALARTPADPDPLVRMAAADAAELLDSTARVRLLSPLLADPVRAVRIAAASTLADVPREAIPDEQRGALDAALREYREVQALNADRAESHLNLGLLRFKLGDLDRAELEYRKATQMMPRFSAAYVNLADLYRARQEEGMAERVLREGLNASPDHPGLHHALGLSLIRQAKSGEGARALRRAHELAPDNGRYAYVFGVALNSLGERDRALDVLEEAHRKRTGDREILVALATISRDAGHRDQAIEYAKRLVRLSPNDPGARQLLSELQE
jgi:Flp pilus assembly protein TadD